LPHMPALSATDHFRVFRYNDKFLVDARVAEWDRAADPDALGLRGRDLVTDAFANHLALELGE
jgi:hypothetical protein